MELNEEKKDLPENEVKDTEIKEVESVSGENAEIAEGTAVQTVAPKVRKPKESAKRTALRWILMTLGTIMMSSSVFFFQTPNNFTLGGVAGIALLLHYAVPALSQGVFIAIINVLLITIGLIILGKQCTVRTIYCSLLYTAIVWGFEQLIGPGKPIQINRFPFEPLTGQPFMELCYAILLFGIGGAIIFNCGSTSGGTDIIAMIMKKFTHLNVGLSLLIIDFVVICITFYSVPVESALFSLLGLFAKSFLLDGVIESIGKTKYITIITKHPDEINEYVISKLKHSCTIVDAEGGYTKESKQILLTVCKRGEALRLKTNVKLIDPDAFVIITDANEILGKGFGGTF